MFHFQAFAAAATPTIPAVYYERIFDVFSFILGAVVGSFLNVCIYRLPLDMAVNKPSRSFCPHCNNQLRWYHNIPILSWIVLGAKCGFCGKPIAVRYPLVELLTGVLFCAIWRHAYHDAWILAFPYWIFVSLVIVATFIDFDHFIIPHGINGTCVGAGLILSFAIPLLMGTESRLAGLGWSLVGAATGFGLLWGVVEAGKLAFGRKRIVLPETVEFTWRHAGENDAEMVIGGERELWSEYFARPTDRLILLCEHLQLASCEHEKATLHCFWDRLELDGTTYRLDDLETFSGQLKEYVFPREAMGYGDVYFIAGIGAFLGWKAVFFTVAAGSLAGSVVGVSLLLLGPKTRSLKIPFGPYLSVGALLWMFAGPGIVAWYLGLMGR